MSDYQCICFFGSPIVDSYDNECASEAQRQTMWVAHENAEIHTTTKHIPVTARQARRLQRVSHRLGVLALLPGYWWWGEQESWFVRVPQQRHIAGAGSQPSPLRKASLR